MCTFKGIRNLYCLDFILRYSNAPDFEPTAICLVILIKSITQSSMFLLWQQAY